MHALKNKKVEIIESLRGLASVYIVIHHFFGFTDLKRDLPETFHFPFRFGQEFVILFFLMSGFVIYTSNQNIHKVSFGSYFIKRFVRIYPIFFLVMILSFLVLLLNHEKLLKNDITDLWGNILMLQDTDKKPGLIVHAFLRNYPLWSLSYEWWFYMLFFPLAVYFDKCKLKFPDLYIILAISALSWIAYLFIPNHLLLVLSHLVIWWSGVYIARLYFSDDTFSTTKLRPVYISLFIMTLLSLIPFIAFLEARKTGLNVDEYPLIDLRHFTSALFIVIVGSFLYKFQKINLGKIIKPFTILAPISYAMYCVHFPVLLLNIPFIHNSILAFLVKFAIIITISYLFELIIQPVFYKLTKQRKPIPEIIS